MPLYLRQSTASQEIPLGYFVDSTDGNTEKTALTINNTDIKIWKTGATTLANKNSGGATHISNGIYYTVLDATDTDTIGPLVVFVHVSGALAIRVECCVLDEAVYDVQFGTTEPATPTNVWAAGTRTLTGADNITSTGGVINVLGGVVTAIVTNVDTNAITAASFSPGSITAAAIADAAIDRAAFAADTGLQSIRSNTAQTGAAGSITLDASASSVTSFYNGQVIYLTGGTGAGQARIITTYNGSTKVATVFPNWSTAPNATTTFAVLTGGPSDLETIGWSNTTTANLSNFVDGAASGTLAYSIDGDVLGKVLGGGSGTITGVGVNANTTQISGDSTAADNAESFFDGTGYAGTNNVIPTVTTVTNPVTITGDAATAGTRFLTMIELDGAVYRYTANALEQGPAGGGGSAAAVWEYTVEGAFTAEQLLRGIASFAMGKANGGRTTTVNFRNLGDSKNRITATVDSDGNRTAVTRDLT